jgi:hypothetical protein
MKSRGCQFALVGVELLLKVNLGVFGFSEGGHRSFELVPA